MAIDINEPPVNEPFVDENGIPTEFGSNWMFNIYEMFRSYLSTSGIQFPQLTTTQRDDIINPPNGLIIHNKTTTENEIYLNGWKVLDHTP